MPFYAKNGNVAVVDLFNDPERRKRAELWYLTDYRVMSVTGGSIWLTPVRRIHLGGYSDRNISRNR